MNLVGKEDFRYQSRIRRVGWSIYGVFTPWAQSIEVLLVHPSSVSIRFNEACTVKWL